MTRILGLMSRDIPFGEKLRLVLIELFQNTFASVPMQWAYPVFLNWFRLNVHVQQAGYVIFFAAALILLLAIRRKKSVLPWCLLYAALTVDILLCVATNHYFAHFILGIGSPADSAVSAAVAVFAFIGLLIATIACHIFVRNTK